jgi:hypothetical protein
LESVAKYFDEEITEIDTKVPPQMSLEIVCPQTQQDLPPQIHEGILQSKRMKAILFINLFSIM